MYRLQENSTRGVHKVLGYGPVTEIWALAPHRGAAAHDGAPPGEMDSETDSDGD